MAIIEDQIKAQESRTLAERLMAASRKLADEAFNAINERKCDDEMIEVIVELDTGIVKKVYR